MNQPLRASLHGIAELVANTSVEILMSMPTALRPTHAAPDERKLEADLCIHIFTASAALVGVCLTVIGLIRIVVTTTNVGTIADDMLACDAMLFMIACMLSYWALRERSIRRMHRIERAADAIFLLGLMVMTAACAVVTWALL